MATDSERLARDFGRDPQPRDLEREIPTVSENVYNRTREAVKKSGCNFIVPIRSVSIKDLLAEDELREQRGEARRLGYVDDSKSSKRMLATVPPKMEVAINPARFKIVGSNYRSIDEQKAMIRKEETRWKEGLPEDVRPLVSMRMVYPSTLSQLEDAYMDKEGKLLFSDYFVRTDVETVPGVVARVGRFDPTRQRDVDDWNRDDGNCIVFAVSVVVLPRKLGV